MVKSTEGFFRESIMTPQNEGWAAMIEEVWGSCTEKLERFAMKKETDIFDRKQLEAYVAALPAEYEMRLMDVELVEQALSEYNLRRYAGLSGTIRYSGYNSVDAVSGATATSRAITDGVNRALAIVADLGDEHLIAFEESETE